MVCCMSDYGHFLRFESGSLVEISESVLEVKLDAADSFLIDDGRVLDLKGHFDRFSSWVTSSSATSAQQLEEFLASVEEKLPQSGRWFPRLEFHKEAPEDKRLYLRLRKAPEPANDLILWTFPDADPRSLPTLKGPDLSLGMQHRRMAKMHGADEAVYLNADGYLVEGALSSIVWWRGDVLCAPDNQTVWLDSITRKNVFAVAAQIGIQTRLEHCKPADLIDLEIWSLGSLHGIRTVSGWVNLGGSVSKPAHVEAFQKRIHMLTTLIN